MKEYSQRFSKVRRMADDSSHKRSIYTSSYQALYEHHYCKISHANINKNTTLSAVNAKICPQCSKCPEMKESVVKSPRFDSTTNHFAAGLVSISRKHLFDAFDMGVPMSSNAEKENTLILYQSNEAIPNNITIQQASQYNGDIPVMTDALEATENCDQLNVLFTKTPHKLRQCTALVGGQYQGYHIQRWMRVVGSKEFGKFDPKSHLHHVSR